MDPYSFHAEFGNFVSCSELTNTKFSSLYDTAKFSSKFKSAFPLTNNAYRLLLTAPVTVAKDERSFSRLKLIKTSLRTTMNNNRLEALLLLSYGKDLTDSVTGPLVIAVISLLKRLSCINMVDIIIYYYY